MGTVTIHNYHFPIHFSYKGWNVELTDKTGFFSMKSLKVGVTIEINAEGLASDVAKTKALVKQMFTKKEPTGNYWLSVLTENKNEDNFQDYYNEAYNHYISRAKEFATVKGRHNFTFGVNGSAMDSFFGQNISATEKACKQIVEYIDQNLGDAETEFKQFIK